MVRLDNECKYSLENQKSPTLESYTYCSAESQPPSMQKQQEATKRTTLHCSGLPFLPDPPPCPNNKQTPECLSSSEPGLVGQKLTLHVRAMTTQPERRHTGGLGEKGQAQGKQVSLYSSVLQLIEREGNQYLFPSLIRVVWSGQGCQVIF